MDPFSLITSTVLSQFQTANFLSTLLAGVIGNRADGLFCSAANGLYKKIINNFKEPVNHDIQKAIRGSYLNATLLGCQSLKKERDNSMTLFSVNDTRFIEDIIEFIKSELKSLDKSTVNNQPNDFNGQFDFLIHPEGKTAQEKLPQLVLLLKDSLFKELELNGFKVEHDLRGYILNGWINDGKEIDWYQLMCAFFREEIKTNSRLSSIIQLEYLTELNQLVPGLQISIDAIKDQLEVFWETNKSILLHLESAIIKINKIEENTYQIEQRLEKLPQAIQNFIRQELNNQQISILPDFRLDSYYQSLLAVNNNIINEEKLLKEDIIALKNKMISMQNPQHKISLEHSIYKAEHRLFLNNDRKVNQHNKLKAFISEVINLSASLQKIEINSVRLQTAKSFFDTGNFSQARAILNEKEMNADLEFLLVESLRNSQNLKKISNEYLILAKLTALNYDLKQERFVRVKIYLEKSLQADQNKDNLYFYANLLYVQNQFSLSKSYLDKCISVLRKSAGNDPLNYSINLAECLMRLSNVQKAISEFDLAEISNQEALEIIRKLVTANPQLYLPDLAKALRANATSMIDKSDIPQAKLFLEEAFLISKTIAKYQPEYFNPGLAVTLNNMAILLVEQNELNDAELFYNKSIDIFRSLADKEPEDYLAHLGQTIMNLANLQRSKRKFELSESNHGKALEIFRQLTEDNPQIYLPNLSLSLHNMANLFGDCKKYDQADDLYKEALVKRRSLAKADYQAYIPSVADTLNNYGSLKYYMNQFDLAEKFYSEAIKIRRKLVESNPHKYLLDLAYSLKNLANLKYSLKEVQLADLYDTEANKIIEDFSKAHPKKHLIKPTKSHS